jgi:hypothetical protein
VLWARIESSLDIAPPKELEHETRPVLAKFPRTLFVHRCNFDKSYESICTKCYVTVAKADLEADLRRFEDAHICSAVDLGSILHPEDKK